MDGGESTSNRAIKEDLLRWEILSFEIVAEVLKPNFCIRDDIEKVNFNPFLYILVFLN